MSKSKNKTMVYLFCQILVTIYSCGDIFATRRHIVGNYYLVEEEGVPVYSVRYKLGTGDYIGRVPDAVVEYGWADSVLIVKTERDMKTSIYVVNMKRDFEFADEADYLIEILSVEEFNNNWQKKLRIKFKKV